MSLRDPVTKSLAGSPVIGVVRTDSREEARAAAQALIDGGLQLVEITFTVPEAPELVAELLAARGDGAWSGPPWIGMGTVTTAARAERAIAAGAEFIVSPNVSPAVAQVAREAGVFLVMGALTPTEIVAARAAGADLVKVYPLPPVGGPSYLATVRGPLDDIPMLAAGGFGIEEIPAYARAGAVAYGIGAPLLGANPQETAANVARALTLARREETA